MHKGSCLCGTVRYEIEGELGPIMLCHCSPCRKATGTAFGTGSVVPLDQFQIVAGREALKEYASSPGVYRVFCSGCGSPLFSKRDSMPGMVRLRIGTLDTPVPDKPAAHIFVADKAEWFDICDDVPQHAERP